MSRYVRKRKKRRRQAGKLASWPEGSAARIQAPQRNSYTIDQTVIDLIEAFGFLLLVAVGYGGRPVDTRYSGVSPRHAGYAVLVGDATGAVSGVLRVENGGIVVERGDGDDILDCMYGAAVDMLLHLYDDYVERHGTTPRNIFYRYASGDAVEIVRYTAWDADNDYYTYG